MITFSRRFLAAGSLFFASFMGLLIAAEVEQARAEYPGGFSRPPSQGKNYNTWKDAQGPDVGVGKIDLERLPSQVDNSTREQFPPIYKQRWGDMWSVRSDRIYLYL